MFKRDAEFASTYDCVLPEETTQEQIYAQLQGAQLLLSACQQTHI